MTTKRGAVTTLLLLVCLALPALTQNAKTVTSGPNVIKEFKHDTGPLLREIAPLLPEFNSPSEHEIDNPPNPNVKNWDMTYRPDPVLQRPENSPTPLTPSPGLEFDALGYGDDFFCNCMPADNDGAPGTTQYVEYINTLYAVYSKTGSLLLGPLSGNSFWSGFGGSCQNDNNGDTIIRFDAAAQRWVASQFAINRSGDDYECVAVSQTDDATGAYYRYAFQFGDFPDYPKMGVWPDAYYFSFNNFNLSLTSYIGANVCAADRTNMLAGNSANLICFQQDSSLFGMLPADLDGATPPAAGTPNFYMELDPSGDANLDMFQFHVDFTTPSNSTFTGPTLIPIAAYTPSCPSANYNACAQQPTAGSDLLETLSDRLMYRNVYRNFGDHTVLLDSHSVQVSGTGAGARWYEIHNPETGPTVYQSGTFSPDSQYRFMPSIAMDQNQDIAVGFTRSGSGSGQYPSLVYAGRTTSDPLGTLESEVTLLTGTGSQSSGGYDRWGDYSSMTVDPTDDCTFWFTESYIKTTGLNGGFNWSTAIGNFIFPGCTGTPNFSLSANPNSLSIEQGNTGTSTITVAPLNGFSGSVTLSASGLPSGVTAAFSTNPTASTSTVTFTVGASAATGTTTVTISGTSGSLTNSTTISLTVTAAGTPGYTLTANPTSVGVVQGGTGATAITVVPTNGFTGSVTLSVAPLPTGVTAGFSTNPTTGTSTLTFTASASAATGTSTVTVTGVSGSLTQTTPVSLTVSLATSGAITLTPSSLSFGNTTVGQTSASKTVTAKNTGTASVTISSIATTASFPLEPVTGSTACGSTLAGGKSCQVKVAFAPTQGGATSGTLTFTDNATNNPQTVALSGTGVSLELNPTALNFGVVSVGGTSAQFSVTITNESASTVSLSVGITGGGKKSFHITNSTCESTLGGSGGNCAVTLEFAPLTTGLLSANLQITSNGGGSPQNVSLQGTGN